MGLIGLLTLAVVLCACGAPDTAGFEYEKLEDGTLAVVGYTGEETDLVIDTFDGKSITRVDDSAFAGNEILQSVTLGAEVRHVGIAAFADCSALTRFDAADSALERIGNAAFLGCEKLAEVTLPETIANIGVDAFLACDGLSDFRYPGTGAQWASVAVGAHNEAAMEKLATSDGQVIAEALASGNCSSAVSWMLDKNGVLTVKGEGRIPDYGYNEAPWLAYAASIRTVVISEGVDIVGKNAFGGLAKLEKAVFAESVRLIDDSAFYGCEKLAEVTLPSNLRRIGAGAFYGCEDLLVMNIPDTVTHIGRGAFMNCRMLNSVTLPASLTGLEQWTFSGCIRLNSIVLPESVETVGVGAFYGCATLKTVTLGGKAVTVEKNAFRVCSALSEVYFRGELDSFSKQIKCESGNEKLAEAEIRKAN